MIVGAYRSWFSRRPMAAFLWGQIGRLGVVILLVIAFFALTHMPALPAELNAQSEGRAKLIILICAMSVAHEDCQTETAIDVVQTADADFRSICGMTGQTTIAATAIVPIQDEEYMKIFCTNRVAPAQANLGK